MAIPFKNTPIRVTNQPNYNFFIVTADHGGGASSFSDNKIGFIIIGNGMNATYNTFIYNAAKQLVTDLGE